MLHLIISDLVISSGVSLSALLQEYFYLVSGCGHGGCGYIACTGYPGLHDPCGDVDAAVSMTAQERADLTLSAQVSYTCTL